MSESAAPAKKEPAKEPAKDKAKSASDGAASTSDAAASSAGSSSSKSSAPSRPISYFSSVSNDDYRSGWDNIFNSSTDAPQKKTRKSSASARRSPLPAMVELDPSDLDGALRAQLDDAFRRKARKLRLNYDSLAKKGRVHWRLVCEFKK